MIGHIEDLKKMEAPLGYEVGSEVKISKEFFTSVNKQDAKTKITDDHLNATYLVTSIEPCVMPGFFIGLSLISGKEIHDEKYSVYHSSWIVAIN